MTTEDYGPEMRIHRIMIFMPNAFAVQNRGNRGSDVLVRGQENVLVLVRQENVLVLVRQEVDVLASRVRNLLVRVLNRNHPRAVPN